MKGRKTVKRLFRKNQVIITALAIMIVVAGYLDHVQRQKNNTEELAETTTSLQEMADLSEEDLEDTTGEALLVSGTIQSDLFAAAKLSREQMRAKNKATLTALIENEEVADVQREEAVAAMIDLTNIAERENAAEVLLQAKGFGTVVVNITDEEVDVCVGAVSLTDSQVAQVQDIVERKTGIAADKMVITLANEQDSAETAPVVKTEDEAGDEVLPADTEEDGESK